MSKGSTSSGQFATASVGRRPARWRLVVAAGLLGLCCGTGCQSVGQGLICRGRNVPPACREARPPVVLPRVRLGDLPSVLLPGERDSRIWQSTIMPADEAYRVVALRECERHAATASASANALDGEADRYARAASGSNSITRILRMQACQVRNDTAAEAMSAWLGLLQSGLQHDLLIRSVEQLDATRLTVDRLRKEGLAMETDLGQFDRQFNDLEDRHARLVALEQDLAGLLEFLMGTLPDAAHPLAPDASGMGEWRDPETPDLEEAVATALACRQDLAILETMAASQDVRTLEAAREALRGVHPLLAAAIERNFAGGPLKRLRLKNQLELELAARKTQLGDVIHTTRQRIRLEIASALNAIERHQRGVDLRKAQLDSLDESLKLLEAAAKIRTVSLAEKTELQSQRLETESALVEQLIERELAWVKLLKSQGRLGRHDE